jgi:peptidoglycan/LPS O-acetylase OafA/YrhL
MGNQSKKRRDYSLDFLRGSAVLFMVITHVGGLFYFDKGTILDGMIWWGATVCFTIFLFVSAAVTGLLARKDKLSSNKLLSRAIYFLLMYFIVGIFIVIIEGWGDVSINNVLEVLLFVEIPEFVEFLLAFVIFSLLVVAVPTFVKKIAGSPLLSLTISLVIYAGAAFLHPIQVENGFLRLIKSLTVGYEGMHTFGVLVYLPVWTAGLVWGYYSVEADPVKKKSILSYVLAVLSVLQIILIFSGLGEWNRWPPSVVFILYGLIFSVFVLRFYESIARLNIVNRFLIHLGKYAFPYYYYHLVVIFILGLVFKWPILNISLTVILIIFAFFVAWLGVVVENRLSKGNN